MSSLAQSKTKNRPKSGYFQQIVLAPVYDLAVETAVSKLDKVSKRLACQVWLKREDMQPVNSFKLRGAHHKIKKLTAVQRANGVVTASAGNHAQGVALSGSTLGIKTTVVMPITTPDIKVTAVRGHGGKVILCGESFDQANEYAKSLAEQEQATFIPSFDDEDIIVGQGTVAKELIAQNPDLDMVFIPVGGGGLLAGMAVYIKSLQPHVQVIGVEFEQSACLKAALDAGKPVPLAHVGAFADGVAVKQIGDKTFALAQQYCDEVITVTSDEICAAIKDIYNDTRAIAEPAGAVSLAGLKKHLQQHQLKNVQVAAILSGANMNFDTLRYVSDRTALGAQTEAALAVTIAEEKGSFRRFSDVIGDRTISEFNYRYADDNKAQIFVALKLSEGPAELALVKQLLSAKKLPFIDLSNDEFTKQHVQYMVGGKPRRQMSERVYQFEFPEHQGALKTFLTTLGDRWNISMFHYRNQGGSVGQVMAGFEVSDAQALEFKRFLKELNYNYIDQSANPGYQLFLQH